MIVIIIYVSSGSLNQHYADVTGVYYPRNKTFLILAVVLISPLPSIPFYADSSNHHIKSSKFLNRTVLMTLSGCRSSMNHWVAPEQHLSLESFVPDFAFPERQQLVKFPFSRKLNALKVIFNAVSYSDTTQESLV